MTKMCKVVIENLPPSVKGFTVRKNGIFTIHVNARLGYEMQTEAIKHEMKHVKREDFYTVETNELVALEEKANKKKGKDGNGFNNLPRMRKGN